MFNQMRSLAAILLLVFPLFAHAAQFYMVVIGESNTPFTPGPPLSPGGPENSVPVLNFTFSASVSNGRYPTKGPIIVHREVDSTSPMLLSTMVNNQVLPEVKLVAVISNSPSTGTTGFYYSLQRAKITGLDTFAAQMPGQLVTSTLTASPAGRDETSEVAETSGQGTLIEKITYSWDGLSAYYFDGRNSKLATWGVTPPKATTSTAKTSQSTSNPFTDILTSFGIL